MAEDEFKQNNILAQYFLDIIKLIISIIGEYNTQINNDNNYELLNDEVISNIYNIINNYRNKYENEKNIKFYPFLNDALQKLMDMIFNDENTNYIINNSIYGKSFINNNITNRNLNINNVSVLNESLNNNNTNNNLKSMRTINSSIHQNININDTNRSIEDQSVNNNNNNNLYNNQSLYNTQRINQTQNIFPNNQNNSFLNKTFSNTYRSNRYNNINNNIEPINEQEELNSEINININNLNNTNNNNINIPRIANDIINRFNIECQNKYKIIINFLIEESSNIIKEQNDYYNKKMPIIN